jgi:ATP-dependent Clp protease ATP-binding subunit ClpX
MSKPDLSCSFCGRPKPETQLLIAGLDAHICDRCINQAHGIVQEETNTEDVHESDIIELKPPKEIKTFLDLYVIGQEESKRVLSVQFTIIISDLFFKTQRRKLRFKRVIF